jgi:hypothetical protein
MTNDVMLHYCYTVYTTACKGMMGNMGGGGGPGGMPPGGLAAMMKNPEIMKMAQSTHFKID